MIRFDLENLFKTSSEHGLTQEEFQSMADRIPRYLEAIEKRKQGFYRIIDDEQMIAQIKGYVSEHELKFYNIVVLGIGGSALGTLCLQQSLLAHFENELDTGKRLYILDNIDPSLLIDLERVIDLKSTLFIVVTKSGSTPETLAQYFYFRKKIEERNFTRPQDHFLFITDPEKGLLRQIAHKEGIKTFDVPEDIGGRFSVLSSVGLVPAQLVGINIEKLLEGARTIRDKFLSNDFKKNLPFQLATIQYLLYKKGKIMNVLMPYSQKLIRFADWYRQLLAESIGKAINNQGEIVNVGITPINALGATDQHSQSQLYHEGPNDKFIMLLEVKNFAQDLNIPEEYLEDESVDYLRGVSFGKLLKTEMEGTKQSLTQKGRPNITIQIERVDEENLGELFLLFEAATVFLGEFLEINAFDQPGVELSKVLTKQLLSGNKTFEGV